jgi:hypothetical protein
VNAFLVLAAIAVVAAAVSVWLWYLPAYRAWKGKRVVGCPGTTEDGIVEVDALRFAVTSLNDKPEVRIESCSRWPENADCEERCKPQLDVGKDGFPRRRRGA